MSLLCLACRPPSDRAIHGVCRCAPPNSFVLLAALVFRLACLPLALCLRRVRLSAVNEHGRTSLCGAMFGSIIRERQLIQFLIPGPVILLCGRHDYCLRRSVYTFVGIGLRVVWWYKRVMHVSLF